ncbi:MAG: serine/threonine protein kinase [Acidobacteriales bacterium]|nr:serine/threonine protein kinase [Terriglobales bacterium]
MRFELGKTVGDYEFLDVLDASQGGRAYKVKNVLAQRIERLKVFPKELQDDRERVDRFLREIKIQASLVHPNIITFYNATQVEGQLVMTTELLDGATLDERLETGPLPWPEAVGYIRQALSALAYAHEQGVVHRMISPANMTVTPEKVLKLTGFDLAKATTDPQLTRAGMVMAPGLGSLEYISPEQVKGSSDLDARTDLYSLGAVFYALVTGKPPFAFPSQFEVMLAHVNQTSAPPSEKLPGLPPELDPLILKALAKDPAQRFQSAKEFRDALETLSVVPQQEAPLVPRLVEMPKPVPVEPVPWLQSLPQLPPNLIALGLFTFLIVAVAFFSFLKLSRL